jgi:apolipoprotein D and lipocalin family protein
MKIVLLILSTLFLGGCLGMPDNVSPVRDFQLDRYLGKWYEIARLDHSFERGLQQVTAEYALRDDGGVSVKNRGFSTDKKAWSEAIGKAYFVNDPGEAYLKVSFFGPFYGSYVIFELGKNYEYAFVSGPDLSYLWLLSRKKKVDPAVMSRFIKKSQELGFDTSELLLVEHD